MSSPVQAVRARWTTFLEKIDGRLHELLGAAEQGLPDLVDLSGFDLLPFSNAMTGVRTQSLELIHKIESTWSGQVERAFEESLGEASGTGALLEAERRRGETLALQLELALRRAEVAIAAAAAERIVAQARKTLAAGFKCSHCAARLPLREHFFRSYYVTCEFCRTVNTFEPGTVVRQVEHFAVHALAERASLAAHLEFLQAEDRYRRSRGDASRRAREQLVDFYSSYIDQYLNERARWLPDLATDVEKDRRARIETFINCLA